MNDPASKLPIDLLHPRELGGLRMTRKRLEVYRLLCERRDHPTAQDLFMRAKGRVPNISLATVYSCLEALVQHGVVRQVNFDREPSRFCLNLEEHGHFHDRRTGSIHDVSFKRGVRLGDLLDLPPGAVVSEVEITLRGELAPGRPRRAAAGRASSGKNSRSKESRPK